MVERMGVEVRTFDGARSNIKVTSPEDSLTVARALLTLREGERRDDSIWDRVRRASEASQSGPQPHRQRPWRRNAKVCSVGVTLPTRFGIGYDAHRLVEGVPLVLAGVHVPHDRGLEGHSDGDVATHAIIDALLGAAALGDIGAHFDSGDPSVPQGVSSIELLKRTAAMVRNAGWQVVNVDATIVIQRPRLAEHITAMRTAVASALGASVPAVSIKATTEDGLGFTGPGDGASALAVASITELTT